MAQLLWYALEPPYVDTGDVDRHSATRFIDAVRQCFDDGGWQWTEEGADRGGTFLVAVRGRVDEIADNYQFFRNAEGIYPIGSGDDVAVGAIHALRDRDAETRVRAGVDAAIAHTNRLRLRRPGRVGETGGLTAVAGSVTIAGPRWT